MTTKKLGRQTVALAHPPSVAGHANVVGKKEGEGPLADSFDQINQDDSFGEKTWEKAESAMQKTVLQRALEKAELTPTSIALDGIAVVVNPANSITGLTMDQIKSIYTGETTDWADVAA